jgi:hypothetical protein
MTMSPVGGRRSRSMLSDLLTFERLLTGPIVHLIYWCGLALILLVGFGAVGASVGLALRSPTLENLLIVLPALAAGVLVMVALALLWRSICEFYLAVFRIAEDLNALRRTSDADAMATRALETNDLPHP